MSTWPIRTINAGSGHTRSRVRSADRVIPRGRVRRHVRQSGSFLIFPFAVIAISGAIVVLLYAGYHFIEPVIKLLNNG